MAVHIISTLEAVGDGAVGCAGVIIESVPIHANIAGVISDTVIASGNVAEHVGGDRRTC